MLARDNITRAELAEASGLKPTYLGDRLRDKTGFNIDDLAAIARVFNMTLIALMEQAEAAAEQTRSRKEGEGPLVTGEGSFTAEQSAEDDEMLRERARQRRRSEA